MSRRQLRVALTRALFQASYAPEKARWVLSFPTATQSTLKRCARSG